MKAQNKGFSKQISKMGGSQRIYPANPADYKLLEEIGNGASATVYRAIYLPLNSVVAVKCLDLDRCNNGNLDSVRRETQTMGWVDHPNLIRAYCSFVVDRNLWVVMPFMSAGSCFHAMKRARPNGLEEIEICFILKETLKALDYLHRQGHIHRDVKAGNILLDNNGAVKLSDFGVSACMFDSGDRQRCRNTFTGTPCWMAPEVMQAETGYGSKADIWSFGITALELAHGHPPLSQYPPLKVLLMTVQNDPPRLGDKKFSKSFKDMVAMCLVKDPNKRPTAGKLLKHSFFKHAKPPELSLKKLLAELRPLLNPVKAPQNYEYAEQLPSNITVAAAAAEQAGSMSEYQKGISAWNFDIEELKMQASTLPLDDENGETMDSSIVDNCRDVFTLTEQCKKVPPVKC